jgi:[amino group carrier protein]-6-phospho-L-2-aminoadipate/5-phospho-L-glutamate reductase
MRAAVVGGSGYIGGELVRLLLGHPHVELAYVTSERHAGRPLRAAHPNLRGHPRSFVAPNEVGESDVVFLAVPHGAAMKDIDHWATRAPRIIDLSADFRIHDDTLRARYYPSGTPDPEWLSRFRTGIPELNRAGLHGATHISVAGCMANAAILALHPLAAAGLTTGTTLVDARTGSSGGGRTPDDGSHHPERSGALRMAKPHGHRHIAEIEQACGIPVHMSVTAVEAVRGVQVVCHVTLPGPLPERDVWAVYREAYRDEPFVRLVRERSALHRLPEPKLLSGTNFCDIGLTITPGTDHLIVVAAIDNLVKGGAGNAVQCLNIAAGWDETAGLGFMGLYPI